MVRRQPNVLIVIGFIPGIEDGIKTIGKRGLGYLDNNRILKQMGEFLGEKIIAPILDRLQQWFRKQTSKLPSNQELDKLMDIWGDAAHINFRP